MNGLTLAFTLIITSVLITLLYKSAWFRSWLKKYHRPSLEELEAADRIAAGSLKHQTGKNLFLKPDKLLIIISFFLILSLALLVWSIFYLTGGFLGYIMLILGIIFLGILFRHHILHIPLYIEISSDFLKVKTLWPWSSFKVNILTLKEIIFNWFEVSEWQSKKYDSMTVVSDDNKHFFTMSVLAASNKEKLLKYFDNLQSGGLKIIYVKSPVWFQWF